MLQIMSSHFSFFSALIRTLNSSLQVLGGMWEDIGAEVIEEGSLIRQDLFCFFFGKGDVDGYEKVDGIFVVMASL